VIVFPALVAAIALACAAFTALDAVRRPRPERAIWTLAFLVFAIAAGAEVLGQTAGWSPALARIYYLTGAVLVVGILALGELYLLFSTRMPAVTPGISLLITAIAITAVWSAPIDVVRLPVDGWRAIERGPFLVALAVAINAGGTLVLAGGALSSAWRVRTDRAAARRAAGCVLIALGTLAVAAGGTLTRFGRPEYLYLAMACGIAVIFGGIVLTRSPGRARTSVATGVRANDMAADNQGRQRLRPVAFERREAPAADESRGNEGVRFVTRVLLERDPAGIAELCRQWGATPVPRDALSRAEAHRLWAMRRALPVAAQDRLDALPIAIQAQFAELYAEVWASDGGEPGVQPAVTPAPLSILATRSGAETREHEHV
jgi:hypothetical protein